MPAHSCIIRNARLVLPDRVVPGSLVVRDGRIAAVLEDGLTDVPPTLGAPADTSDLPVIDARGSLLSCGLVEMHIHGAGGIGFESVRTGAELLRVRDFLAARGIGTFVPTLLWDEESVAHLVAAVEEADLPAGTLPGIYLEGPFINPARRGGIPESCISPPDPGLLRHILDVCRGRLRIMTVAPELPGADALYDILYRAGVLPSLGHSDCSLSSAAIPAGRFSVTHLFNAMSGVDHRGSGGLANLGLTDDRPWVELNADGVHVNASAMRLASRAIRADRLVLTSDAISPAGSAHGHYLYRGKDVESSRDGVRYVPAGTLVGSNRLGAQVLRSFAAAAGVPLAAAFRAMTANPAAALGISDRRGALAPGLDADLFLWDDGPGSPRRPTDPPASGRTEGVAAGAETHPGKDASK